jgi:hypothetical protein
LAGRLPGLNDLRSHQHPIAQYFPAGWTVDFVGGGGRNHAMMY